MYFSFIIIILEDGKDEMDKETRETLTNDFEIGQYIRERIVPRAVLYFTGEAVEDDDESETSEEDGEDSNDPEESDEDGFTGANDDYVISV